MNRQNLSLFLIAAGIITTLMAYFLFYIMPLGELIKIGWGRWLGELLVSILILGCFSLLPLALMAISVRLSRERPFGLLLVTLTLLLMISITEFFFVEILRSGKYNNPGDPNLRITPGDTYIFLSGILHWFTAAVTLVIAGLSRAIEKNQSSL